MEYVRSQNQKFIYLLQEIHKLNKKIVNSLLWSFKSFYSHTENLRKYLTETLKKIQQAIKKLEMEEQTQLQLFQYSFKCSSDQINQLVEILQRKVVKKYNLETNFNQIQDSINWLKIEIKHFEDKCRNQMNEIFSSVLSNQQMQFFISNEAYRDKVQNQEVFSENNLVLVDQISSSDCKQHNKYKNGKKEGLWKETMANISKDYQVYEVGEYVNDKRFRIWKQISQDKEIGQGFYNFNGQKDGRRMELNDQFLKYFRKSQTIKIFSKNQIDSVEKGRKVEKVEDWVVQNQRIIFQEQTQITDSNQDIGRENEHDIKIGVFVFIGEYLKGQKTGRWNIYWKLQDKLILFGGGRFGEQGKTGDWIELSEKLNQKCYLLLRGKYKKEQQSWKMELRMEGFLQQQVIKNIRRIL